MNEKAKWTAAGLYMLVLADSFSAQFLEMAQLRLVGYYVNVITLTPLVVFYAINKAHSQQFVREHVRRALVIYWWYVGWSVPSGIFFESNNLWVQLFAGSSVTILMLLVMIYVAVASGRGIIRVFRNERAVTLVPRPTATASGEPDVADSIENALIERVIANDLAACLLLVEQGADPRAQGVGPYTGHTALDYAKGRGHTALADCLKSMTPGARKADVAPG
jgi:hypothetical protein